MSTPQVNDPATWVMCVALGCTVRVDPLEHSFRCLAHRGTAQRRHVTWMSPDEVHEMLATAELYDPDFGRRLLDRLVDEHPNLIATAIADQT